MSDDIFKMKTSLEFDVVEYKFQSKNSILELIFPKQQDRKRIAYTEFDLGKYANQVGDSTVKTGLDLKSEEYPGCLINIYINIQVLDPLPDQT